VVREEKMKWRRWNSW